MTMHGFGLGTGSPPPDVEEVIKKLKRLTGIARIEWIIKKYGDGPDFQIIFEFTEDHPDWDEFGHQIEKATGIKNLSLYNIPY